MTADQHTHRFPPSQEPVPPQTRRRLTAAPGDRIIRQLTAIDDWNAARRMRETVLAACVSRQDKEAARLEVGVLDRTHQAIAARAATQLAQQAGPLVSTAPTAVIAHRHTWFADKVTTLLQSRGVAVLECTDNGADALGAVISEQPDVVLAGDRLAMMPGEVLMSETRLFAPRAWRAVQTGDAQQAAVWRPDVHAVFVRQQPPADVVEALYALCSARTAERSTA